MYALVNDTVIDAETGAIHTAGYHRHLKEVIGADI